mmetsp:Transcript_23575/g.51582  ORF Transcript_23575/g.51582 Transcript_23575/m.51582 type:complete len:277 (+) Transcript_23575:342-1172(+)
MDGRRTLRCLLLPAPFGGVLQQAVSVCIRGNGLPRIPHGIVPGGGGPRVQGPGQSRSGLVERSRLSPGGEAHLRTTLQGHRPRRWRPRLAAGLRCGVQQRPDQIETPPAPGGPHRRCRSYPEPLFRRRIHRRRSQLLGRAGGSPNGGNLSGQLPTRDRARRPAFREAPPRGYRGHLRKQVCLRSMGKELGRHPNEGLPLLLAQRPRQEFEVEFEFEVEVEPPGVLCVRNEVELDQDLDLDRTSEKKNSDASAQTNNLFARHGTVRYGALSKDSVPW